MCVCVGDLGLAWKSSFEKGEDRIFKSLDKRTVHGWIGIERHNWQVNRNDVELVAFSGGGSSTRPYLRWMAWVRQITRYNL